MHFYFRFSFAFRLEISKVPFGQYTYKRRLLNNVNNKELLIKLEAAP